MDRNVICSNIELAVFNWSYEYCSCKLLLQ